MRRYGLRDDQWDRIKDFLPGREGHVGGTADDNRLFVEAVLYLVGADFVTGTTLVVDGGRLLQTERKRDA